MTLKPLVALTVVYQTLEPGVAGDEKKGIAPVAPKVRIVEPFSASRRAFMAQSEEEQAGLFKSGCVAFAPEGTQLDPESAVAEAGPVKKAALAAKPTATKTAAKPAASAAPAGDDTAGMV